MLGEGSIGMTCSYSDNSCELYAKNNGEFRGWYVDGELISTDYMLSVEYGEGIDIVACYTDDYSPVLLGDVDGDSSVTLADAIQVARCAIGVSTLSAELPNAETAADFDGQRQNRYDRRNSYRKGCHRRCIKLFHSHSLYFSHTANAPRNSGCVCAFAI